MKRKSLILEGAFDVELMKRILPANILSEIDIYNGGGSTSAISKARTLLAFFDKDIVILLDTDTTNGQKIQEQKGEIEFLLKDAAKSNKAWHLILAEPEIEVILFQNKELAKSIFHQDFTDSDLEFARVAPRKAIEKKLAKPFNEARQLLLSGITESVARELRKTDLIQEIEHELSA